MSRSITPYASRPQTKADFFFILSYSSDLFQTFHPLSLNQWSKSRPPLGKKKSWYANRKPFGHLLNLTDTKGFERRFVRSARSAWGFLTFTGCRVGNRCSMGTYCLRDGATGSGFTPAGYVTVSASSWGPWTRPRLWRQQADRMSEPANLNPNQTTASTFYPRLKMKHVQTNGHTNVQNCPKNIVPNHNGGK